MFRELAGPSATTLAVALALGAGSFALSGCTPAIGDHCTLSTDCSVQGTRICDTSQPNGYCTQFGCAAGTCPDNAACVEVNASVPGCGYDDYNAPSRIGRSMCMRSCQTDSDCRESEGYTCVGLCTPNPDGGPCLLNPSLVILDGDQTEKVCMIAGGPPVSSTDAQVCVAGRTDAAPLDLPTTEVSSSDASQPGEASSGDGASAADGTSEGGGPEAGDASDGSATGGGEGGDAAAGDGGGDATLGGDASGAGDATLGGDADATAGGDAAGDVETDAGEDAAPDAGAVDAADGE